MPERPNVLFHSGDCVHCALFSQKLKDNCDPVYEETFEYREPLSESRLRTLEVLVVSKKTFARNPVLGMVGYPKRVEDV